MKSVRPTKKRARADSGPSGKRCDPDDILRVIGSIPAGAVASYGEIAARAGWPGRARLVGHVLAETPARGATVPWHRVLRSNGRIAFAPGSRQFREQARRLAAEGVLVVAGRVDLVRHGWDRNLDAVLWAPETPKSASSRRKSRVAAKKR